MKAKIVREDASRRFDTLVEGDWFLDGDSELAIKIDENDDAETNAIYFAEGDSFRIAYDPSYMVTPVNVTITYS